MSDVEVEYEPEVVDGHESFDPYKVSASRLNKLMECGTAFKMHYIDHIPAQRSGSAALFGNVMHSALERWGLNRKQSLVPLVRSAWLERTEGTVVKDFLGLYQHLSVAAIKKEHDIREAWAKRGKESKQPRMTKEWKESDVGQRIAELTRQWAPRLSAGSPWTFRENDPLPGLYDESLVLAKRLEARWGHLPPVLVSEFAFDVPYYNTWRLTGYIDTIEPVVVRETGEQLGYAVMDYKSYRREPPEFKDYRQLVMYDVAVRYLVAEGHLDLDLSGGLLVGIDYLRWTDSWDTPARRFWRIGDLDYQRLTRELRNYSNIVAVGAYQPAPKSTNPDYCDYGPDLCCLRSCSRAGGGAEIVSVAV